MKTCSCCGRMFPATTEFFHRCGPKRRSRDGFHSKCKLCRSEEAKKLNSINTEKRRDRWVSYYALNREKELARGKTKYLASRESVLAKSARRFQEKKEQIRQRRKSRLRQDPILRLNRNVGRVMNLCLVGGKGGTSWKKLVGYTPEQLKTHLELLFLEGMSWSNYGRSSGANKWWTVDHRRPIASFVITGVECDNFKECWDLANLQPMWSTDNFGKGAKHVK